MDLKGANTTPATLCSLGIVNSMGELKYQLFEEVRGHGHQLKGKYLKSCAGGLHHSHAGTLVKHIPSK